MKITLLQQDIVWADPLQNVQRADDAINRHPGADLYVFPEMFSTGFCTASDAPLELMEGDTLRWMRRKAVETDAAIAGSLAMAGEDGKRRNRFLFVKPDGTLSAYDKRHLFTYGGENRYFEPGSRRVVVNFRGVRILLQVCYDLRFPVWSRNQGDYDLMLYVASWPHSRMEVWNTLLKARAIENQCYVAGVNRVGTDPTCVYSGGTQLVDAYGRVLAACESGEEGVVSAVLDLEKLAAFRQKFPVLADADDFEIKL